MKKIALLMSLLLPGSYVFSRQAEKPSSRRSNRSHAVVPTPLPDLNAMIHSGQTVNRQLADVRMRRFSFIARAGRISIDRVCNSNNSLRSKVRELIAIANTLDSNAREAASTSAATSNRLKSLSAQARRVARSLMGPFLNSGDDSAARVLFQD